MLLLLEEVGELAKSIRKSSTNMGIDKNKLNHYDTVESEVADVFIVLCNVCNKLDIDLYKALKDKEQETYLQLSNIFSNILFFLQLLFKHNFPKILLLNLFILFSKFS